MRREYLRSVLSLRHYDPFHVPSALPLKALPRGGNRFVLDVIHDELMPGPVLRKQCVPLFYF